MNSINKSTEIRKNLNFINEIIFLSIAVLEVSLFFQIHSVLHLNQTDQDDDRQ